MRDFWTVMVSLESSSVSDESRPEWPTVGESRCRRLTGVAEVINGDVNGGSVVGAR